MIGAAGFAFKLIKGTFGATALGFELGADTAIGAATGTGGTYANDVRDVMERRDDPEAWGKLIVDLALGLVWPAYELGSAIAWFIGGSVDHGRQEQATSKLRETFKQHKTSRENVKAAAIRCLGVDGDAAELVTKWIIGDVVDPLTGALTGADTKDIGGTTAEQHLTMLETVFFHTGDMTMGDEIDYLYPTYGCDAPSSAEEFDGFDESRRSILMGDDVGSIYSDIYMQRLLQYLSEMGSVPFMPRDWFLGKFKEYAPKYASAAEEFTTRIGNEVAIKQLYGLGYDTDGGIWADEVLTDDAAEFWENEVTSKDFDEFVGYLLGLGPGETAMDNDDVRNLVSDMRDLGSPMRIDQLTEALRSSCQAFCDAPDDAVDALAMRVLQEAGFAYESNIRDLRAVDLIDGADELISGIAEYYRENGSVPFTFDDLLTELTGKAMGAIEAGYIDEDRIVAIAELIAAEAAQEAGVSSIFDVSESAALAAELGRAVEDDGVDPEEFLDEALDEELAELDGDASAVDMDSVMTRAISLASRKAGRQSLQSGGIGGILTLFASVFSDAFETMRYKLGMKVQAKASAKEIQDSLSIIDESVAPALSRMVERAQSIDGDDGTVEELVSEVERLDALLSKFEGKGADPSSTQEMISAARKCASAADECGRATGCDVSAMSEAFDKIAGKMEGSVI